MTNTINRRKFLKIIGCASAAIPAASVLSGIIPSTVSADPTTAVDPAAPMSVQFGYNEDATKVDVVKFPKKAAPDGATQSCKGCQLYVKGGLTAAGKTGEYGMCSLFPTGLVSANGWCNMWTKKIGA